MKKPQATVLHRIICAAFNYGRVSTQQIARALKIAPKDVEEAVRRGVR